MRKQAIVFYANGKLDRTLRTVRNANQLCHQEALSSERLEHQTLSDLGLDRTGKAIAPSDGGQLLENGLAKKAQGDLIAAQKLFDRARVRLESVAAAKTVLEPNAGMWNVTAMSWSADGTKLAVATNEQDIHVLDTDNFQESLRFRPNSSIITSVAFSPDSGVIASSAFEQDIELWDLSLGKRTGTIEWAGTAEHIKEALRTLVFSPDGKLLAGQIWEVPNPTLWNVPSRKYLRDLDRTHGDALMSGLRRHSGNPGYWPQMLTFSPDGSSLLGVYGKDLALWNLRSEETRVSRFIKTAISKLAAESFYSVAFHPNGRLAAVGTESGKLLLWDIVRGTVIRSVKAHRWNPLVGFSADGKRLLSVSTDGHIRTFVSDSLSPLLSFENNLNFVEAAALHPDAQRAAIAGDGFLIVQDVVSGKVVEAVRPTLPISAIAIDRNVTQLAMGTMSGAIVLLSVRDGSLARLRGHTAKILSLVFSPDGRQLISTSSDKAARIWETSSKNTERVLEDRESLSAMANSPSGQIEAIVGTVSTPSDEVDSVVFSADGRFSFGVGHRGSMLVWSRHSGALLFTLRWIDESSAYAIAPNGLLEWLGPRRPDAVHCRLGTRIYPAELCDERYTVSGLIADKLSKNQTP